MSLTQFDVGINFRAIDNLTRPVAGFGRAIRDSLNGADRTARNVSSSLNGVNGTLGTLTKGFGRAIRDSLNGADRTARNVSSSLNGVNGTLGTLTKGFGALGSAVGKANDSLKTLGLMPATGGTVAVLAASLDEAKKYQTEMAKFSAQTGFGDTQLEEADKWSRANKLVGLSTRDTLTLLSETNSVLRDMHHAEDFVPVLSKMKFGFEAVMGGGHGHAAERQFMDALKVVELRGGFNDAVTGKYDKEKALNTLNLMTKAYSASGGLVNPTEYLNLIKTGGVAAKRLNDNSFFFGMMHMMQEQGGNRVGTSLMSGYQNWALGRTTTQVAEEMLKAGLIGKDDVSYTKTGKVKKILPNKLNNVELFRENPFEYMEKEILPKMRARGIQDGDQMQNELDKLYSNRTFGSLLNTMYRERELIKKHSAAGEKAAGIDDLYQKGLQTFQGQKIVFDAKWADFKLALGLDTGFLDLATSALKLFGGALSFITNAAEEHPTVAKYALGTLAVGAGAATLLAGTRLASNIGGWLFGKQNKGNTAGRIAENLLGGGIQKVFVVNLPGAKLGDFEKWEKEEKKDKARKASRTYQEQVRRGGGATGKKPGIIRRTVSFVWRGISNLGAMLDRVTGGRLGRITGLFSRLRIPTALSRVGGMLARIGGGAGVARTAISLLWRVLSFTPLGRIVWLAAAVYTAFTHWDAIWPRVKAGFAGMVSAIATRIRGMVEDVRKQPSRIIEIFATLPFQLIKLGADAINGFIKGMFDVDIGAKAREIGNRIVGGVKSALNIQSPSRVMMALGGHTIGGLALGIEKGSSSAVGQMSNVARRLAGQRFAINAPEFAAASNVLPFHKLAKAGQQAATIPSIGATYNITVNAAPGMDAAAIAREVQRQIANHERNQSRRKEARFADGL